MIEREALAQLAPCGHPRGAAVHGGEGTSYCCACEERGRERAAVVAWLRAWASDPEQGSLLDAGDAIEEGRHRA